MNPLQSRMDEVLQAADKLLEGQATARFLTSKLNRFKELFPEAFKEKHGDFFASTLIELQNNAKELTALIEERENALKEKEINKQLGKEEPRFNDKHFKKELKSILNNIENKVKKINESIKKVKDAWPKIQSQRTQAKPYVRRGINFDVPIGKMSEEQQKEREAKLEISDLKAQLNEVVEEFISYEPGSPLRAQLMEQIYQRRLVINEKEKEAKLPTSNFDNEVLNLSKREEERSDMFDNIMIQQILMRNINQEIRNVKNDNIREALKLELMSVEETYNAAIQDLYVFDQNDQSLTEKYNRLERRRVEEENRKNIK